MRRYVGAVARSGMCYAVGLKDWELNWSGTWEEHEVERGECVVFIFGEGYSDWMALGGI